MIVTKQAFQKFKEVLSFKSPATYKTYLSIINDFLLQSSLVVNEDTMLEYLKKQSPNSVMVAYYALKFFCNVVGIPFTIPHSLVAPKGHIKKCQPVLTREEIKALIDVSKKYGGTLEEGYMALFTIYGCRRSEAYDLKPEDIYEKDGNLFVKIYAKKGGQAREHLIPEFLNEFFIDFKETLGKIKKKFSVEHLNFMFTEFCKLAGITQRKRLNIHAIRRALVSELNMIPDLHPLLVRDFLRWKPWREDIMQVYVRYDPLTVDKIIFEKHPFLEFWK